GARSGLPGTGRRALESEVFAQRLAGIVLVEQSAALQFRHDVLDEIGVGAGHIARGDDKAVAAAADKRLLELVGDLLRYADDRVLHLAAAGEGDEVARRRVGLARGTQHAVANAEHALHAPQFLRRQRLVDALGGEVEVEPLGEERQRIDLEYQLLDR